MGWEEEEKEFDGPTFELKKCPIVGVGGGYVEAEIVDVEGEKFVAVLSVTDKPTVGERERIAVFSAEEAVCLLKAVGKSLAEIRSSVEAKEHGGIRVKKENGMCWMSANSGEGVKEAWGSVSEKFYDSFVEEFGE